MRFVSTPDETIAEIRRRAAAGESKVQIARELQVGESTVKKYWPTSANPRKLAQTSATAARTPRDASAVLEPPPFMPEPAPEAGGATLPKSMAPERLEVRVDNPGWWLVLGDVHLPMHDVCTVEAAVNEARAKNAVGVLLNGDIMDMFGISPFFRIPSRERFIDELECAKQFIRWLRSRLPNARIIWREGNHEFRFQRYVADRAPALFDVPDFTLPALLKLADHGIEWVQDKRKVLLGKLITLHGHELRKGQGVNPARFAFLRSTSSVLVGHWHRTSEHHQRSLADKNYACWSVGCACHLSPDYDAYGDANHGYAMVQVGEDRWFSVLNRRVLNGRVA